MKNALIKSALAVISFAGMTLISSQAFAGGGAFDFTSTSLQGGTAGVAYSQTLTAPTLSSPWNGPYASGPSFVTYPGLSPVLNIDGLTVSAVGTTPNILISGTPINAGTFTFHLSGTSQYGNANYINSATEYSVAIASSGGVAPEMNASFIPQVGLLLGCLFFLMGRKKQDIGLLTAA